jgi:hypothetical protein
MSAYTEVSQEVWDEITMYLSPVVASLPLRFPISNLEHSIKCGMLTSCEIQWHESTASKNANIVLFEVGLDLLGGIKIIWIRPSVKLSTRACCCHGVLFHCGSEL